MKRQLLIITMALLTTSLFAADKDDAKAAAKKLATTSYSWKSTVEVPENSGGGGMMRPGPTEGKFSKEGVICVVTTRGENTTEAFVKGEKAVIKMEDGWKTLEELTADGGQGGQPNRGMFMARAFRNYKSPAAQAESIIDGLKDVKKSDDAYVGDMTEASVKELLSFGGRRPGSQAPEPKDAKGSAKFWIKDGLIAKYQFNVQGKMTFGDQEREINRTTTVEIKDVGTTKVEVPAEVGKKL